jgi:hypothetical protein
MEIDGFFSFSEASRATSIRRRRRSPTSSMREISPRVRDTSLSQSRRFSYICFR